MESGGAASSGHMGCPYTGGDTNRAGGDDAGNAEGSKQEQACESRPVESNGQTL